MSLSLGDFGTGWSSLSYLKHFPVDRIKIDRAFAQDLGSEPAAKVVVESILRLGRSLNIACVAAGVETREQYAYFKERGCAEMQGFFLARPVAAVDLSALLRSLNSVSPTFGTRTSRALTA